MGGFLFCTLSLISKTSDSKSEVRGAYPLECVSIINRSGYMTKKKLTKEELKQKQKAGRRLDANIEKYLRETSKGR